MKKLHWKHQGKDRERMIRAMSIRIEVQFERAQEFVVRHGGRPSVDLEGLLDVMIDEYAYNAEWISQQQKNAIIRDALSNVCSFTKRNSPLYEWAARKWELLR